MAKGYKIGDACKELDVQPYVLRYWETEFPFLRPEKASSGPRVYSEKELGLIRRIKELLYDEGYTIAGAKKKLEAELASGKDPGGTAAASSKKKGSGSSAAQRTLEDEAEEAEDADGSGSSQDGEASSEDAPETAAASLDSSSNEQIETIARGLRALREEARELLELLQAGGSAASEE